VKKYLIIRSVKAELLPFYMENWEKQLQNSEFDLLTHSAAVSSGVEIIENKFPQMFNEIHIYNKNADFSIMQIPKKLKYLLKSKKYDGVIIPHKSMDINGFSNVIILAFLFSKKVFHGNINGEINKISIFFLLKYLMVTIFSVIIFLFIIPVFLLSLLKSIVFYNFNQKALLKKNKFSW
jgi:hypothetical protein